MNYFKLFKIHLLDKYSFKPRCDPAFHPRMYQVVTFEIQTLIHYT